MSDYYTESQINRIEEDAYNGAIFEAGKEWERQRDEFDSREYELQSRIAELEGKIDQLIEAGDWGAKLAINIGALSGDDQYKLAKKRYDKWDALVKDWKEG